MGRTRGWLGAAVAAIAGAVASARILGSHPPPAPNPPAGTPHRFPWRHAEIFVAVRGAGPPALLVHDLYTGAAGAELEPLADRLDGRFTVHVADLPGFGRSGRPAMRFGPDLFIDAVVELVRHGVGEPTLLVASGLGAAYAVEAAVRLGDDVTGVVLLGPPEPEGIGLLESPSWRPLAYQLLRSPLGIVYHHLHATPIVQRRTHRRALAAEPPDFERRIARLSRSARQPGGHWPLWSLWVGDLAWDARPALARLGAPALVLWGAETRGNPAAPETYEAVRPDLEQRVVPGTARWPHVDDPDRSAEAILDWWGGARPTDPA